MENYLWVLFIIGIAVIWVIFSWIIKTISNSKKYLELKPKLDNLENSIKEHESKVYKDFPSRSVPADIHGILMRVASLEDTLRGKIKAWRDTERRQSKKLKHLGDIARLVESHPQLWELLDPDLKEIIQKQ